MSRVVEVQVESALAASRDEVWRSVSSMRGVNVELHPYIHMTSPKDRQCFTAAVVPGRVVFRSWLLLFRVLPFDRHALAFERIDEGVGFVEESTSFLQQRWGHERSLSDSPSGGCVVTDRLLIEPRVGFSRPLVAAMVPFLFRHRHRRLRNQFGAGSK